MPMGTAVYVARRATYKFALAPRLTPSPHSGARAFCPHLATPLLMPASFPAPRQFSESTPIARPAKAARAITSVPRMAAYARVVSPRNKAINGTIRLTAIA